MRKMTKTAVTLAAMSAMTAAAASMAFAAEKQEPNISSVAKQVETVNSSAVGEWSGSDVDGWKFTKEDGTKLRDQWAEIDGVWYYFIGEKIARDRFLTLDNKGYFFDNSGRLATGWQKITSDMDAYSDIDIADELYDQYNNYYVHINDNAEYGYHDFVYCYFDNSGVAKHNEWFQDGSGLWYYFDGDVMVKNVYDYQIRPDNYDAADSNARYYYGFDEEGAMLVGWNYKEVTGTWNDPTADDKGKIWYYYNSNGRMQSPGWKSIDGKWYLFADRNADYRYAYTLNDVDGVGTRDDDRWSKGGYPLITNSYVASYNKNKYEYFYVDKDGKMVIGVKEVPKEAYKVLFYTDKDANGKYLEVAYDWVKTDKAVTVNFGSNGAAKDGIVDNRYYVLNNKNTNAATFDTAKANYAWKVNNSLYNAAYVFDKTSKTTFKAISDQWSFSQPGSEVIQDDKLVVTLPKGTTMQNYVYSYSTLRNEINDAMAGVAGTYYFTTDNSTLVTNATNIKNDIKDNSGNGLLKDFKTAKKTYTDATKNLSYAVQYVDAVGNYDANTWWALTDSVAVTGGAATYRSADTAVNVLKVIKTATEELRIAEFNLQEKIDQATAKGLTDSAYQSYIAVTQTTRDNAKEYLDNLNKVKAYLEKRVPAMNEETLSTASKAYDSALKALNDKMSELYDAEYDLSRVANYEKLADGSYQVVDGWNDDAVAQITNDFTVVGELVKAAFIGQNDYVYFADDKGDLITNKAVVISTVAGLELDGTVYNNAYILFGSDGKGIYGYDGTRKSISIGGVTYWATDATVEVGSKAKKLTVFVSNKQVNATTDRDRKPQY